MSSYIYLSIFLINIILNGLASSLPEEYEAQVKNYPDIIQSKEKCLPQQGNYDFASTLVCDPDGLLTVAQKTHELWCEMNHDQHRLRHWVSFTEYLQVVLLFYVKILIAYFHSSVLLNRYYHPEFIAKIDHLKDFHLY
ncbi:unnamed protein product [Schistosoma turkestanicum]|nr:unnamed protein product [Schistosoma turkestanicum]